LLNALPDPALVLGNDALILRVNLQAEAMFGYASAEILGRPLDLLVPQATRLPHPVAEGHHAADRAMHHAGGDDDTYMAMARRKDGTELPVAVYLRPLPAVDTGQLIVVTIHDLSSQFALERDLRAANARMDAQVQAARADSAELEALLEAIGDGVFVYESDRRIRRMNTSACRLLGLDAAAATRYRTLSPQEREELLKPVATERQFGDPAGDGIADVAAGGGAATLERIVGGGETLVGADAVDLRLRGLDGQERVVSASGSPLRDARGTITGAVGVLRDVTARRQLEQRVAEQAAQLEAILGAIPDGVLVVDAQERVRHINAVGRSLLQLGTQDFASIPLPEHNVLSMPPSAMRADDVRLYDQFERPLPAGELPTRRAVRGELLVGAASVDVRVRATSGRWIDLNATGAPVRDANGHLLGGVVVFRDVTTRRQAELRTADRVERLVALAQALLEVPPESVAEAATETVGTRIAPPQPAMSGVSDGTREGVAPRGMSPADTVDEASHWRMMPHVAALARDLLECHTVTLVALAPDGGLLLPLASVGFTTDDDARWRMLVAGTRLTDQLEESLIARLTAGEMLVLDMSKHPIDQRRPNLRRTGVVLIAPLRIGAQLVGTMTLDYGPNPDLHVPPASVEALALVATVAELAARVLERDHLQRERRARADAEAQLRLLQTILDELPCAVYLARGPEARMVLANRAVTHVWGAQWRPRLPMATFLAEAGISVIDAHGHLRPGDQLASVQALQTGLAIRGREASIRRADGSAVPVLVTALPLPGDFLSDPLPADADVHAAAPEGAERLALVVMEDVSLLKAAEQLKDEFITVAAHELRGPMGVIRGYAQLMKRQSGRMPDEEGLSPRQADALQHIVESTDRLRTLTEDLLDITRLQAGRLELDLERHELLLLVRRVVARLQVTAPRHNIRIRAQLAATWVRVDERRIEQVLANLLGNAIKYSPGGGRIVVEVSVRQWKSIAGSMPYGAPPEVQLAVRDRGIGIPRQQQEAIFGRFARADNARQRRIEGTGLGLFLCRELVELHGGRIWFESTEGIGSTFYVTLPLADERPPVDSRGRDAADAARDA
jgi:PAS domain S-box-containing protein